MQVAEAPGKKLKRVRCWRGKTVSPNTNVLATNTMHPWLDQPGVFRGAVRLVVQKQVWLPPLLCCLLAIFWFWPITFAGLRPTGGEISTDFRPAMQFYGHALQEGRLPLWNEQDGLGSPIHATGQIGNLYPFRLLFYRFCRADNAYVANMVLHYAFAAWFAYLCARGFGLSHPASILVAVTFMGQGFFVVNLSRPWSYTAGCWLPLAVLASWRWIQYGSWSWWFALSATLALQVFAGHFQIAFQTALIVLLMGVVSLFWWKEGVRKHWFRNAMLFPAVGLAVLFAGAQLIPTMELLRVADLRGRGEEFLGSFAMHPLQLLQYLGPTLLQHPLWEPSIWTAFRSSPSQCLQYVGMIPFGLALWTSYRQYNDRRVKIMISLVVLTTLLGFGSHLPGWNWLVQFPGLGWFSSSARWGIASGLFLAMLAGLGVDRLDPQKFPGWCRVYVVAVTLLLAVGISTALYLVLNAGEFPVEGGLAFRLLEQGIDLSNPDSFFAVGRLVQILRGELTLPALNIGILLLVSLTSASLNSHKRLVTLLIVWTTVDLLIGNVLSGRVTFAADHVAEHQSPVMQHLADVIGENRHNERVAGATGRRPMSMGISGLGNITLPDMQAYWNPERRDVADYWPEAISTLPPAGRFGDMGTKLAREAWVMTEDDVEFLRLAGIRWLTVPHITGSQQELQNVEAQQFFPDQETGPLQLAVDTSDSTGEKRPGRYLDPKLSADVFGAGILRMLDINPSLCSWSIWEVPEAVASSRCWLFPVNLERPDVGTDPRLMRVPPPARRKMLDSAVPLPVLSDSGERLVIEGVASRPAVLVVSDLYYPGWYAYLEQEGKAKPVMVERAFGAYRAIAIPQAGPFRLLLNYEPPSFKAGLMVSALGAAIWLICVGIVLVSQRKSSLRV